MARRADDRDPIAVDDTILEWRISRPADTTSNQTYQMVRKFFRDLNSAKTILLVPATSAAKHLGRFNSDREQKKLLEFFTEDCGVIPFDLACSLKYAEICADGLSLSDEDRLFLAVLLVHPPSRLITQRSSFRAAARSFGLNAMPIPKESTLDLFDVHGIETEIPGESADIVVFPGQNA